MAKWHGTKFEGIRYREHASRIFGIRKDRYYAIRYRVNGQRIEEPIGWESQNDARDASGRRIPMEEVARATLARLKEGHRAGHGPKSLAASREEAERVERQQEAENVTLHDYFHNDYLPAAKQDPDKKPKTWGRELSLFNNWIDPLLGHVKIQEIAITQWDFLVSAMVDGGLSPRSRQYACMVLRVTLEHAFRRKLVKDMPPRAKLIGATMKAGSNRRTRVVTNEELQAILEELARRDMHAYRITVFCALTCCRFGEAAKLEWIDVDLEAGRAIFRKTKNDDDRAIPLSGTLVDLLREIGPGEGLVFKNTKGQHYRQTPEAFRKAVAALGLNEGRNRLDRLVFHSLRHTGATKLGQKIPLRNLMDLGGWKTPSMALRYQHTEDQEKRAALAVLENMTQAEPAKVVDLFGKG
ncbi:MAG: site-specific integrase [Desulfovibrionales bacterium]|nr:site-specific integrase [Desulfovibrionales bacterium]